VSCESVGLLPLRVQSLWSPIYCASITRWCGATQDQLALGRLHRSNTLVRVGGRDHLLRRREHRQPDSTRSVWRCGAIAYKSAGPASGRVRCDLDAVSPPDESLHPPVVMGMGVAIAMMLTYSLLPPAGADPILVIAGGTTWSYLPVPHPERGDGARGGDVVLSQVRVPTGGPR